MRLGGIPALEEDVMKFSLMKNNFNDTLAVQILDYNFDTGDVRDVISLIRQYGMDGNDIRAFLYFCLILTSP